MKRQLEQLKDNEYDILIIGGGILGLFIAWDATLRGLSVALIDKGDFGGATSSNSLRIIHGGFRHIQNLDFRKIRRFIKEQRIFMKIAPHLVRAMPVIIPLYSSNFLRKILYYTALKIYDLLGIGLGVSKEIDLKKYSNRFISREECIEIIPDLEKKNLSSGIIFTDCQLTNSERFSIQVAKSAYKEGAHLANYVEALALNIKDNKVKGAAVRDNLTGDEFEIHAKFTVNSSGPWLNSLLSHIGNNSSIKGYSLSKAFNLSINRELTNGYALGLNSQIKDQYKANLFSKNSRYFFITPWNGKSLIGTEYLPTNLEPDNFKVTSEEMSSFLDEINASYPAVSLRKEDVEFVYGGYVPTYIDRSGNAKIGTKNNIYDHEKEQGLSGLFSARVSKYTEARIVAQETVDVILRKIGKTFRPSTTESTLLSFGKFDNTKHVINEEIDDNLIKSQIIYAIQEEMAQKLTDVIFRRIDFNFDEIKSNLKQYSRIMAKELNWDDSRIKKEEEEVYSRFSNFH
ncbi:MAG: FAD-dependent oxidoreductase [Thermodesulfobacteriota bacterium]